MAGAHDDSSSGASEDQAATDGSGSDIDSLLRAVAHVPSVNLSENSSDANDPGAGSKDLGLGDILAGRYKLESVLGAGGMGTVYAARNTRTGKEVAIKVLQRPHGTAGGKREERIARFMREAAAASRIRHPNVVDVYDVLEENGQPFIVMERLHGESLRTRLRGGALSAEQVLTILIAAMRGVAEAHRQGVIHRDLKPDNIFLSVSPGRSEAVPKVVDFGVSRVAATETTEERLATLTRTGYVLGTPSYMPIEQLRGEPVDVRSDVYALGVIAYECLSGSRPFNARNERDLAIKMATERPLPLLERLPTVDPDLASIVMKALQNDPADRYQDVPSFQQACELWLAGDRSVGPRPTPEARPAALQSDRKRSLWGRRGVVLAVAVFFAIALAAMLWQQPVAPARVAPLELANPPLAPAAPLVGARSVAGPAVTEPLSAVPEAPVAPPPVPSSEARPATWLKSAKPRKRGSAAAATVPAADQSTELKLDEF